ncbi:uncharacterized protein LOC122257645 [Penaeus japonicus]|uniref:uncharacterized protein LOC122257645 n=1 Tax=Penaeus japonicus TaxID=27405 RepID=UPI001C711ED0|nr:uncharacterized protein LOC122257645 [Penaeus japonicus]
MQISEEQEPLINFAILEEYSYKRCCNIVSSSSVSSKCSQKSAIVKSILAIKVPVSRILAVNESATMMMSYCKKFRCVRYRYCLIALLFGTFAIFVLSELAHKSNTIEKRQGKQVPGYTKLLDSRPNAEISKVLDEQRRDIEQQMKGYMFPAKLNVSSAKDLVLAEGGQPVRSLIVTSWRSGSTFMGDILRSHPGTYYHYEPLHDFGIKQVRSGGVAAQALHNLKHFLSCDYSEMVCVRPQRPPVEPLQGAPRPVLEGRVPVALLQPLPPSGPEAGPTQTQPHAGAAGGREVGSSSLLIYVAPPRRKVKWCSRQKDCDDPETLCKDLLRDYVTASVFSKKFPRSFRAIRYEDFSFNVYNMTKELLDFFHLDFHPNIQKFLATHTNRTKGNSYSTFRDSRAAPVHWQKGELTWKGTANSGRSSCPSRSQRYSLPFNLQYILHYNLQRRLHYNLQYSLHYTITNREASIIS